MQPSVMLCPYGRYAAEETDLHQTASAGIGKCHDDWAEDDQNRVSDRILDRCSVEIDQ
jgi:hypothetical protein